MHKVTLHFQKAGLLTTVQDKGRFGYLASGVPIGGAMDQQAARIANELVGNEPNTPVLEITLLGPIISIKGTTQIALTGANLSPKLNGGAIPMYETITLRQDSILSFGKVLNGCRTYLAIRGNWQIEKWLGSYSAATFSKEQLTPDSIIQKNKTIEIIASPFVPKQVHPIEQRAIYKDTATIQVLPGPEFEHFTRSYIGQFFSQSYRISNDSNRMGYRLLGDALTHQNQVPLISSGIVPGTIQINNAGLPILLMRDAQTTGGYPRIANVVATDMNTLAQMKPGGVVRFSFLKH